MKEYHHSVHRSTMSSSKRTHRHNSSSPPSSSSSYTPSSSLSSHGLPSSSTHPDSYQAIRGRRGRQARPSQLSPTMRRAVSRFANCVGAPQVVEPAGFRDFRGWLARLASQDYRHIWDTLIANIANEVGCKSETIHALKEDIVREIVKKVVIPRPDESAKLVSTNAGRQASKPRSGLTLMIVLEQQLDRIGDRFRQLVASELSHTSNDDVIDRNLIRSSNSNAQASGSSHHGNGNHGRSSNQKLPSISDILPDQKMSLPSFVELDESVRKHRSGSK